MSISRGGDVAFAGVDWRQPKRDMDINHDDSGARLPLPARWPEVDGELMDAYEQIVSLDAKISEFFKAVGDDGREIHQGYLEAEDARFAAIDRLSEISAQSWKGIKAKSIGPKHAQIQEDYESRALSRNHWPRTCCNFRRWCRPKLNTHCIVARRFTPGGFFATALVSSPD
jgi:hypothetical protein